MLFDTVPLVAFEPSILNFTYCKNQFSRFGTNTRDRYVTTELKVNIPTSKYIVEKIVSKIVLAPSALHQPTLKIERKKPKERNQKKMPVRNQLPQLIMITPYSSPVTNAHCVIESETPAMIMIITVKERTSKHKK